MSALDGLCRCDTCRVTLPLPAGLSPREVGDRVRAFEREHVNHAGARVVTPVPPPLTYTKRGGCYCSMCAGVV